MCCAAILFCGSSSQISFWYEISTTLWNLSWAWSLQSLKSTCRYDISQALKSLCRYEISKLWSLFANIKSPNSRDLFTLSLFSSRVDYLISNARFAAIQIRGPNSAAGLQDFASILHRLCAGVTVWALLFTWTDGHCFDLLLGFSSFLSTLLCFCLSL